MAQYDQADLDEASEWIKQVTGQAPGEFPSAWKDGVMLCELANHLKPGVIAKVNKSKLPFHKMENIENFTKAARALGVVDRYNFVTVDLWEEKNLAGVLRCLLSLKRDLGFGFKQHHASGLAVFDAVGKTEKL